MHPNNRDCPNFVPVLMVETPRPIPGVVVERPTKDVNESNNMSGSNSPIPPVEG